MSYQSFEQVLQKCHTEEKEFWQVILEDDMAERNVSLQESMEHMRATWDAMLLGGSHLRRKSELFQRTCGR